MKITLYPGYETPSGEKQPLALQGNQFIRAHKTKGGWVNDQGQNIKVHWWTYAPDKATATGRDILKLDDPIPAPSLPFLRIKKTKPLDG